MHRKRTIDWLKKQRQTMRTGQALVEYALILVLVGIAFGFALAATGPVIGNVFSNTVYNLVGPNPTRDPAEGGPDDFWATVTWVAGNPLEEVPLPTRTVAPPTSTGTPGPSPTPSPTVPSATPEPTFTPPPTSTPADFEFDAPWLDTVDNPEYWRINSDYYLGSDPWLGRFYNNTNLGGAPSFEAEDLTTLNGHTGDDKTLNFDWQGNGPNGSPDFNDTFSASFSRNIYLDNPDGPNRIASNEISMQFKLDGDDGKRLYLIPGWDQTPAACGAPCLIIDDWNNGSDTRTATVNVPMDAEYTLYVEYYENSGGARISLTTSISSNPDDTNLAGGSPDCQFVQRDREDDANSLDFMWDPNPNGWESFPQQMRCYLELRGYVFVPGEVPNNASVVTGQALPPMQRPQFVFWNVWDFEEAGTTAWLEIAEYTPLVDTTNQLDRDNLNWQRVDLHTGASRNYNWTRQVVDLTNVNGQNYVGKNVTFRFVMENVNNNDNRRWFIDDIEILDGTPLDKTFAPNTPSALLTMNSFNADFTPNRDGLVSDFITSGHWDLTSEKVVPDTVDLNNGVNGSCCSWELRDGHDYERFSSDGDGGHNTPYDYDRLRIHYIELNGWVDFTAAGNPGGEDDEGDTGDPMLSFWQAYEVGRRTGIEVQYTTQPIGAANQNWQVVPGPLATDPPAGRIVDVNNQNDVFNLTLAPIDIPLAGIERVAPNQRFRLRFALLVHEQATRRDGWWIDHIYLHREPTPSYLDYPLEDSGEIDDSNWTGSWFRASESDIADSGNTGDHFYTDSPFDNYAERVDSSMQTRWPIDLLNDTPYNLSLTDRNPLGGNTGPDMDGDGDGDGGPAVNPMLSFWHVREVQDRAVFRVEWRKLNETEADWKPLWAYVDRMNTVPGDNNDDSRVQRAWEYVEVDLSPIMDTINPTDADTEDDDIYLRFRLFTTSTSVERGIAIDDIVLNERPEPLVHQLWPDNEERTVGGENLGTGDGLSFASDLEEDNWFDKWRLGGDWEVITWEQRNGLNAFHDSVVDGNNVQEIADTNDVDASEIVTSGHRTYNILEMTNIIDMRATQIEDEPTLYFWHRYWIGDDDEISVQISRELNMTGADLDIEMGDRCADNTLPQCYEQVRGWSEWVSSTNENTWPYYIDDNNRDYAWRRVQVDLTDYASPNAGTPGDRIRIRFVMDAMDDRDNNEDGWYIDNLSIEPLRDQVVRNLDTGAFTDVARNLNNWVAEGKWGLSPELASGSSGGPATLGTWREYFWNCGNCESLAPNGTNGSNRYRVGTDIFLDGTDGSDADATRTVLDISYDINRDAPRPGIDDDRFVGRWVLNTPVVGPTSGVRDGDYTFITISDDGVRMKWEEIDADGNVISPAPADDLEEWNIIYNWTDHGRTGDMGNVTFDEGKRYRLTLEYYEKTADSVIILSTGGSSFSFTDSPKQGVGLVDIPAIPRARSSLILDGVLDLSELPANATPIITYLTYYESRGRLKVQVSTDGGYSWTDDGLRDDLVFPNGATEDMDNPDWNGLLMPPNSWQSRRHNLTDYVGQQIMLRFQMDMSSRDSATDSRDDPPSVVDGDNNGNEWFMGWWITDIRVGS